MTETPRDPFTPDPVTPDPVEPQPVEPPTPPDPISPPEPIEPISPPEPVDPISPPEPVSPPDPITPPDPVPAPDPVQPPAPDTPPLGSGTPEPLPAPEPVEAAQPPTARRGWLPVAAVALTVLLLAGATGWLGWHVRQQSVAEDGRPDAVAAARDAARLLFSYNHQTLEEDFAAGLAVTTGEFRSEYSRTTKDVVTPVAEQYDAVVVAEVVEASIVEDGPGRATVLVFLNQGTTSTRVEGQQVDQSRVRMQLVEVDGRWLVRAVDAL